MGPVFRLWRGSPCIFFIFLFYQLSSFCHASGFRLPQADGTIDPSQSTFTNVTRWQRNTFNVNLAPGTCSQTEPCVDGSCCNGKTKFCGKDPEHCDPSVCISHCDAKSECGRGADPPGKTCPLNVCCSQFGNCGTTADFCTNNCQSNCDQPGPTNLSPGHVQNIVIGYFESWSLLSQGCAQKTADFIKVDSLTHVNVAFGYVRPNTYDIVPIPGASTGTMQQITNLKRKAPGLKIWLALGGWTYSDNGTDTQPVFGDLSSTPEKRLKFIQNLAKFMREWGFDGVDFDWEYPGAPDRGGQVADTKNYVSLVQDVNNYWNSHNTGWGLSFTAPTSYWYLRWFDIQTMTQYVDWVNLMTYDLHGSWDSPEDYIGSYVFAHTNLTEIQDALNLLWRNSVPASKINLGLGFYGRTYTLSDPGCSAPGCAFKAPGVAGPCTGTGGFLSYKEISDIMDEYSFKSVYDEQAAVNYFAFNKDQWISYDDVKSIKQKVDFANQQGLLGLFIWAIDEDNNPHDLLNAALYPDGLGKFANQNSKGFTDGSNYTHADISQCLWSACGKKCGAGTEKLTDSRCDSTKALGVTRKELCCPLGKTPKPDTCTWRIGSQNGNQLFCTQQCNTGEILVADSKWPVIQGQDAWCLTGSASYCCKAQESGTDLCGWNNICIQLDKNNQPVNPATACPAGRKFVTYAQGTDVNNQCDRRKGGWMPFCCDESVDASSCHWQGSGGAPHFCDDVQNCKSGEINLGAAMAGGGEDCEFESPGSSIGSGYPVEVSKSLCCNANKLSITTNNLPVPLENIFVHPGPSSDKQKWDVDIDSTMGGEEAPNSSDNPNLNSFGWYIMSGPQSEITSLHKRDDSHWDVYDCDERKHDGRQTAKMVCIDETEDSNCNVIRLGRGVAETVVEMPEGCGAGKYAMAVSLEPSQNQTLPHHLRKRGLKTPIVYDFTFDFDFTPIQRRGDSNVLLRIDYSDEPGYWDTIVSPPAGKTRKSKREIHETIHRDHGGSYKEYLEHTWRLDKRSTPEHELHLLHKRWFSEKLADWLSKLREVDLEYTAVRHSINEQFRWYLFKDRIQCTLAGIPTEGYFAAWADLNVQVETSALISLIGNLGDLSTFQESSVLFRNKGSVKASLNAEAFATLQFSTGQVELVGAASFGATFTVPGIVTIGPNFRVLGQIDGKATLHAEARVDLTVASWDYTQRYPPTGNPEENEPIKDADPKQPDAIGTEPEGLNLGQDPIFYYDVGAQGQITLHMIPQVTFGVVWNNPNVANTAIDFGVDARVSLYGSAGSNSTQAWRYCYGATGGVEIFARVSAPKIFRIDLNNYFTIWSRDMDLIPQHCDAAENFDPNKDKTLGTW